MQPSFSRDYKSQSPGEEAGAELYVLLLWSQGKTMNRINSWTPRVKCRSEILPWLRRPRSQTSAPGDKWAAQMPVTQWGKIEGVCFLQIIILLLLLGHFSSVWLVVTHEATLSMGFSRQDPWSGCQTLLQRIFPTQELNPSLLHLLHCRRILYLWATGEAHK